MEKKKIRKKIDEKLSNIDMIYLGSPKFSGEKQPAPVTISLFFGSRELS